MVVGLLSFVAIYNKQLYLANVQKKGTRSLLRAHDSNFEIDLLALGLRHYQTFYAMAGYSSNQISFPYASTLS
jgi:hypothetical protein